MRKARASWPQGAQLIQSRSGLRRRGEPTKKKYKLWAPNWQKEMGWAPEAGWRQTEKRNQLCMDDRLKVAIGAVLIAAIFVTAAGGNWLTFLFFAAMAVTVTWEFS